MPEENQNQTEQKNTVATIGMRLSIVFSIPAISIILLLILFPFSLKMVSVILVLFIYSMWLPFLLFLFVWFILWIIWLFYKPKAKARVAICIPVIVAWLFCFIWNSLKSPVFETINWAEKWAENTQLENVINENFDDDKFEIILQKEFNDTLNSKTEIEREDVYNNTQWKNVIEKSAYLFADILKPSIENSMNKYINNELPEIDENDDENNIIDVDVEVTDDENDSEEPSEVVEEQKNVEVFTDAEKNDIEQIIDILE